MNTKRKIVGFIGAALFISLVGFFAHIISEVPVEVSPKEIQNILESRTYISKQISSFVQNNEFPEYIDFPKAENIVKAKITYTLDPSLQKAATTLLNQYKPDYGSIFAMDADTGKVLAMTSFQKNISHQLNLTTYANFPAASVFKIITATAAVDSAGLSPSHKIQFNGGNYTLYRKNVMSDKVTRWTRVITLKDAFARSINTAFGRLSLKNLTPKDIYEYSSRFMFNQEIPADFHVDTSTAYVPEEKSFELTEVASGYNKTNRMSPTHGAMIAASVVNNGTITIPFLVDSLTDAEGKVIYKAQTLNNGQIMTKQSAEKVRELMEQTILAGTSRKTFRNLIRNKKFKEIEMGGKTGHLTGDNPKGRVDWFVGYAYDGERKIALAAITVNKQFWTVKSSYLGQSLFKKYFEQAIAQAKLAQGESEQ